MWDNYWLVRLTQRQLTGGLMKILYLGGVGPFGGASRSLYEAVNALSDSSLSTYFLMPRGTAMSFYKRVATDTLAIRGVTRFDHTRWSYYRRLRWLVAFRELFHVPSMVAGLYAAQRKWPNIDIIHVNEITEIIPGILAKRIFGARMIIHVRSLVHDDLKRRRTRWLHYMLRKHADAIIAIDETVRASLPSDLTVDIIHNSFTSKPVEIPDKAYLMQLDGLRPGALRVGFVGNLFRTKGIVELLHAARLVKQAGSNVQFLIVGGATAETKGWKAAALRALGLANNVIEDVYRMIKDFGLEQDFLLLGPTADIQRIYPCMDVLAFPSHLDSCGRPVFEAAFFGVPSIVAVGRPTNDTLVHGQTGLAISKPDHKLIADAILTFDRDRGEVRRMGENARELAETNFRPDTNARRLLEIYRRTLTT